MDGKMHCFIDLSEHIEISKINLTDKNVVSCVAHAYFHFIFLNVENIFVEKFNLMYEGQVWKS